LLEPVGLNVQSIAQTSSKLLCIRENQFNPGSRVPPALPKPQSTGLTGGDIAGIVVGAVVGAVFISSSLFWLWKRQRGLQRRQKQSLQELKSVQELNGVVPTEADSAAVNELPNARNIAVELEPGVSMNELAVNEDVRHEMVGSGPEIVELPTGGRETDKKGKAGV
jgi:hypothetical protein